MNTWPKKKQRVLSNEDCNEGFVQYPRYGLKLIGIDLVYIIDNVPIIFCRHLSNYFGQIIQFPVRE